MSVGSNSECCNSPICWARYGRAQGRAIPCKDGQSGRRLEHGRAIMRRSPGITSGIGVISNTGYEAACYPIDHCGRQEMIFGESRLEVSLAVASTPGGAPQARASNPTGGVDRRHRRASENSRYVSLCGLRHDRSITIAMSLIFSWQLRRPLHAEHVPGRGLLKRPGALPRWSRGCRTGFADICGRVATRSRRRNRLLERQSVGNPMFASLSTCHRCGRSPIVSRTPLGAKRCRKTKARQRRHDDFKCIDRVAPKGTWIR